MKTAAKSFSIKNGNCHIFPDRIEIINTDPIGRFSAFLFKKGIKRAMVLYLLLLIGFVLSLLVALQIENYFLAAFFAVCIPLALYYGWTQRKVSLATVIPREQIASIDYNKAVKGVSRASFTIFFTPKKTTLQKPIPLPSLMQKGNQIADTAYWMMKEEGLL